MLIPASWFKLIRFVLVGGTVMLFFMALNGLLVRLGLGTQGAFLAAYVPALGLHFCLNKWWTFGGVQRHGTKRQVGEYILMAAVTFVIQWLAFQGFHVVLGIANWLAAGLANLTQMGVSFLMMQRRVFVSTRSV